QGIKNGSGTVEARNSIFAANSSSDFVGTLNSNGYNLIQNTSGTNIVGPTVGNQLGVNPQLGPLKNNGGRTETHALLSNSPALDAGDSTNPPPTDQSGFTRIFNTNSDICAF